MGTTRWRTRSQRIRTEGEVPFEVVLVDAEKRSVYQRVAEEAEHLRRLGLSNSKIASILGWTTRPSQKLFAGDTFFSAEGWRFESLMAPHM